MSINPASHQDNKNIHHLQNNNLVLKDELNKKFADLINYMALQNRNTVSGIDWILYSTLLDIDYQAKVDNLVLPLEPNNLFHSVCKTPIELPEDEKAQGGNISSPDEQASGINADTATEKTVTTVTVVFTCPNNIIEPHPDQKYIDALLTDNTKVVKELCKKFSPLIHHMVLKNSGNLADGKDLFQEAMMIIIEKARANTIVLTVKFECFLYKICKNQWLSKLRSKESFKEVNTDIAEIIGENPMDISEEAALQQKRSELFWEKFFELAKHCQELLVYRWAGNSTREVARMLNLTHTGCRTKQAKIKTKLESLIMGSPKFASLMR